MKKGERTCKVQYNSLLTGFFCLQNGSFEEGNPGYLRVWLKIRQKNPGFSDFSNAGGRKANVLGGRLPIKDQVHRKVGEAQERYCGLLGRGSLLYKNLLYAFFSSEKHRGCEIFNQDKKKKMGRGSGTGVWGSKRRTTVSLLGWQMFICTL